MKCFLSAGYVYATLANAVICLMAMFGIVVLLCTSCSSLFQLCIQFCISLAVGSLTGDALLHLLPMVREPEEMIGLYSFMACDIYLTFRNCTICWTYRRSEKVDAFRYICGLAFTTLGHFNDPVYVQLALFFLVYSTLNLLNIFWFKTAVTYLIKLIKYGVKYS